MKRRQLVFSAATFALLTGCGVLPNLGKPATTTPRVARVGFLNPFPADNPNANLQFAQLKQTLADLGYVEGQSIVFERRDANSNVDRTTELANELIQIPVDVLVVWGTATLAAAQRATTVVPIVFENGWDPDSIVELGIVPSLAHPGGNFTGSTGKPWTLDQKCLVMLAQLVPGLGRVSVVLNTSVSPADTVRLQVLTTGANAIGVQLQPLEMQAANDVEPALAEASTWHAQAIINFHSTGPPTDAVQRIVDFALQNRIAVAALDGLEVQAGALLGYMSTANEYGRIAAKQVDKILKGARPADIPVEVPSTFDLYFNQTTAQKLGINIPPEVAQQVTQWVQ